MGFGKSLALVGFSLLAVFLLSVLASAAVLPVEVQKVEINDIEIFENESNRLAFDKGQELAVRVRILGQTNLSNVEIQAFISGFEFNRFVGERISDNIELIEVDEGVSYVRTLKLRVPTDVEVDSYKLRLLISDRQNDEIVKNYNLFMDAPRHNLEIKDISLNPAAMATAGSSILGVVRVKNEGQKQEKNVKVTLAIPDLGVWASDFIDKIGFNSEKETEELLVKLPRCATAGTYDAVVTVDYNEAHNKLVKRMPFQVLENSECKQDSTKTQGAVVVQQPPAVQPPAQPLAQPSGNGAEKLSKALETILIVLVVVLAVVGLVVGLTRLRRQEEAV